MHQEERIQEEIKLIRDEINLETILLDMKSRDNIEDVRDLVFRGTI